MTTVEFNTRPYQFAHGRAPRGRGGWAFTFNHDETVHWVPGGSCTFAEAKKWATQRARAMGVTVVVVTVCT